MSLPFTALWLSMYPSMPISDGVWVILIRGMDLPQKALKPVLLTGGAGKGVGKCCSIAEMNVMEYLLSGA